MFQLPTSPPSLQQQQQFENVMRDLLECDDEDIDILAKLRWQTLRQIKQQPCLGCFSNLPRNTLGQDIIFLHQYMIVTNVQDEVATMTVKEWQQVDRYLIDSLYLQQRTTASPSMSRRTPPMTAPVSTTNAEKYDYVVRELRECDSDKIAILKKAGWRTLGNIHNAPGIGSFLNLPNDSLRQGIIILHRYMVVMNVLDEIAVMPVADWNKVDHYLIASLYSKGNRSTTSPSSTNPQNQPPASLSSPTPTPATPNRPSFNPSPIAASNIGINLRDTADDENNDNEDTNNDGDHDNKNDNDDNHDDNTKDENDDNNNKNNYDTNDGNDDENNNKTFNNNKDNGTNNNSNHIDENNDDENNITNNRSLLPSFYVLNQQLLHHRNEFAELEKQQQQRFKQQQSKRLRQFQQQQCKQRQQFKLQMSQRQRFVDERGVSPTQGPDTPKPTTTKHATIVTPPPRTPSPTLPSTTFVSTDDDITDDETITTETILLVITPKQWDDTTRYLNISFENNTYDKVCAVDDSNNNTNNDSYDTNSNDANGHNNNHDYDDISTNVDPPHHHPYVDGFQAGFNANPLNNLPLENVLSIHFHTPSNDNLSHAPSNHGNDSNSAEDINNINETHDNNTYSSQTSNNNSNYTENNNCVNYLNKQNNDVSFDDSNSSFFGDY